MNNRHEMLLFRYSSALERGDFETVSAVLHEAERDPALEAMIVEMNEAYAAEQTERFNHTNQKEISMLAPLYQNRTQTNTRSQHLLLIAAIALVAVTGVLLMMQIRGNNVFNTGQPDRSAAVAQNEPLCQAVTTTGVSVLSLPSSTNGVVVGTIPVGVTVRVLDQSYFLDGQGNVQMLWYFIAAEAVQGWASPAALDTTECPQNQAMQPVNTFTPTPVPLIVEATALPPTVVPPNAQALATFTPLPTSVPPNVQELSTFTPLPLQSEVTTLPPTVEPPEGWIPTVPPSIVPAEANAAPDFPVYIVEEGDTLLSILNKFGFDASALRDISIINQLPEDAALTPGQEILIPFNMPDLVTTCNVKAEQGLMVWVEPTSGRNTAVTTLPAGTSFEITGETEEPDGIWVEISTQVGNVMISGAWVRLAEMDFVTDCRTDIVPTVEAVAIEGLATFTPQPTPDPLAVAANFPPDYGCTIETQNVVNVQDTPSSAAPVREQLPAGTPIAVLAVSRQPDGAWYMVVYRSRMGSMLWGVIAASMLDVPDDCPYYGAERVNIPEATWVSTATPLPTFTPTPAQ